MLDRWLQFLCGPNNNEVTACNYRALPCEVDSGSLGAVSLKCPLPPPSFNKTLVTQMLVVVAGAESDRGLLMGWL